MRLHELAPAAGSRKTAKRVGRGRAGKGGKTAGRGTKGAKARGKTPAYYEGGQMPLYRRLPKRKGFTPHAKRVFQVVNLQDLASFASGAAVGPPELAGAGLVRDSLPVKILGLGDLDRPLSVRANAFSASAITKIEAAGGSAELLKGKT